MDMIELADLTPDPNNANLGTERGAALLERSIERYGLGRSIVTDRDGVILAGNKTFETAGQMGFDKARLVETDGTELVVVRRTDLEAGTPQAVGLALADNRAGEVNLQWDFEVIEDTHEKYPDEVDAFFFPEERLTGPDWVSPPSLKSEKKDGGLCRVVIAVEDVVTVNRALRQTGIKNRGEALAAVCRVYLGQEFDVDIEVVA